MKKILVIGSSGQLGSAIMAQTDSGVTLVGAGRDDCDITNPAAIEATLKRHKPTHVVNCAAYLDVIAAESNPGECFQLNAAAVLNLAKACNQYKAALIQISSDYVFDGTQGQPYKESAKTHPLNTYGISKVASEHFAAKALNYKVVRISSLFGLTPNRTKGTFIHKVLQRLKDGENVSVYDHHTVTMSYADDVAKALLQLTGRTTADTTFHLVNEGLTSWFNFATRAASRRPGLHAGLHVRPQQEEAAEKAIVTRPAYSALANTLVPPLPSLEDAIERFMLAQKMI